jgi:tetratricopeptide (TPR) repeat protein
LDQSDLIVEFWKMVVEHVFDYYWQFHELRKCFDRSLDDTLTHFALVEPEKSKVCKILRRWLKEGWFLDIAFGDKRPDLVSYEARFVLEFSTGEEAVKQPPEGLISHFFDGFSIYLKSKGKSALYDFLERERHPILKPGKFLSVFEQTPGQLIQFADVIEKRLPLERHLHAIVDSSRQLIDDGSISKAVEVLNKLESDLRFKRNVSAHLRSRISTNLGVCYLMQDNIVEAKIRFERALELDSSAGITWANRANLGVTLNDSATDILNWSTQGFEIAPDDPRVLAVHLIALHGAGKDDEVADFVNGNGKTIEGSVDCLIALGQNAFDLNDFVQAEHYYAAAAEHNRRRGQAKILLASAISRPVMLALKEKLPVEYIEAHYADAFERALQQLDAALSSEEEFTSARRHALNQKAQLLLVRGENDKALLCCDEVLANRPDDPLALTMKGLMLSDKNDFAGARAVLEKVQGEQSTEAKAILVKVYGRLGLQELARKACSESESLEFFRVTNLGQMLGFQHDWGNIDAVAALKEKLLEASEESGEACYWLAVQSGRENNATSESEFLRAAIEKTSGQLRIRFRREYAGIYAERGQFNYAAELYEKLYEETKKRDDLKLWLWALKSSGGGPKAAMLARKERTSAQKAIPGITDFELYELERQAGPSYNPVVDPQIRELLEQLIAAEPSERYKGMLKDMHVRSGNTAAAEALSRENAASSDQETPLK